MSFVQVKSKFDGFTSSKVVTRIYFSDEFVAKVDARDYLQTGATVELGFDLNKAHFFDKETEKTVY